jgi:hypothetical protein
MTERQPRHVEVQKQRLRVTAYGEEFVRELAELTRADVRPHLAREALFLYSTAYYGLPIDARNRSPEDILEWRNYRRSLAQEVKLSDKHNVKQPNYGEHSVVSRYENGRLYVRFTVLLGDKAARAVITPPMYSDERIVALGARNELDVVYVPPAPISESLADGRIGPLERITLTRGLLVNELTVVSEGTREYSESAVRKSNGERADGPLADIDQPPDTDDNAA